MILNVANIAKSFGTALLFKDITFHIEENEKAALTGINGCGKSTLLKIIMGEETADSGEISFKSGSTVGYLAQHHDVFGDMTVYEYVLDARKDVLEKEEALRNLENEMKNACGEKLEAMMNTYARLNHEFELADGYAIHSETVGVIKGLGFAEEDFDRPLDTLSGGQKTRVALGRLLVSKPDILLLDEPTNHLDMDSIGWLEGFLSSYPGAVFIVSHDRYFLDRVVTRVVEIENKTAMTFTGNYTAYSEKKAIVRRAQLKAWQKQQDEIRHQEAVITKLKSFNREKSIKRAESREKMLAKIERLDKPSEDVSEMHLTLTPAVTSGNDVLEVTGLSKSFPQLTLFEGLDFSVYRGEKIALIGSNGTGKTTLLKILNGLVPADAGTMVFGTNVEIGYYDQEQQELDLSKSVFQEISDEHPMMTETEIRNLCAAFLFTNDEVFEPIGNLSGGERGRVSLAKLMLSNANFLILDEPTNHLDMPSREILEDAINAYEGTVFYVSHDRYFINRTATRILELKGTKLIPFDGNYDYYLEKKEHLESIYLGAGTDDNDTAGREPGNAAADWKSYKEDKARVTKHKNDLAKAEKRIEELEAAIKAVDEEINLPDNASNAAELARLTLEREKYTAELDEAYLVWEGLME